MYTVAICCSKKFKKQERIFARKLRELGLNVYEAPLHNAAKWDTLSESDKVTFAAGATYRHFHKISKSDAIFVLNEGGYIGVSVNMEIGYAAALNKKIFFKENDSEYARKILIDGYANTAKVLMKRIHSVQTPDILD